MEMLHGNIVRQSLISQAARIEELQANGDTQGVQKYSCSVSSPFVFTSFTFPLFLPFPPFHFLVVLSS